MKNANNNNDIRCFKKESKDIIIILSRCQLNWCNNPILCHDIVMPPLYIYFTNMVGEFVQVTIELHRHPIFNELLHSIMLQSCQCSIGNVIYLIICEYHSCICNEEFTSFDINKIWMFEESISVR